MTSKNLLIVDDEKRIRETIQTYFKSKGYQALVAADAQEAINIIRELPNLDLIITDVSMPGAKDGISLLTEIKQNLSPFSQVIILTGYPNVAGAVKAMEKGAFTYITKPFDFIDLHRAAERALKKRRQVKINIRRELQKENLSDLGKLWSGLAHNLMSPVQSILGFSELCLAENDLGKIKENLRKIITSTGAIRSSINSLLTKVRKGYSEDISAINLNDMINNELELLMGNLMMKTDIEVRLNLAPELPPVTGVYIDFSQVFLNVVNNAIEAMRASPVKALSVTTRGTDNSVLIEIEDTGTGISPQDLPRIFQPSFTTKTTKRGYRAGQLGTGLGLYSALQISQGYQGTISVESRPGQTKFTIKIPISQKPGKGLAC